MYACVLYPFTYKLLFALPFLLLIQNILLGIYFSSDPVVCVNFLKPGKGNIVDVIVTTKTKKTNKQKQKQKAKKKNHSISRLE